MTTLAELRQANLKEQKQSAQDDAAAAADQVAVRAGDPASPLAFPPVAAASNGHSSTPASVHVKPQSDTTLKRDPLPESRFFEHVRSSISHKQTYSCGAKVSADMAPALFHRAKRYCLDHGNVTLRQVLLDLLSAYLEEEGY